MLDCWYLFYQIHADGFQGNIYTVSEKLFSQMYIFQTTFNSSDPFVAACTLTNQGTKRFCYGICCPQIPL